MLYYRLYTWIAVILTLVIGAGTFNLFALTYQRYINSATSRAGESSRSTDPLRKTRLDESSRCRRPRKRPSSRGLELFARPGNSILYTYGMLLQVSLPRIPTAWAVRVFIGWWWLYSILVTVAYRASMTATLANPIGRSDESDDDRENSSTSRHFSFNRFNLPG